MTTLLYVWFSLFCVASSILLENDDHQRLQVLEQKVQQLTNELQIMKTGIQYQTVAFMSTVSQNINNPAIGHQVVFDQVLLNTGNAYDNRHGIFKAPFNGTYQFALELSIPPSPGFRDIIVHLKKKSQNIAYIYASGTYDHWIKRSASAVVHLDAGDDVYVMVDGFKGVHTIAGGALHSIFSGFLIK